MAKKAQVKAKASEETGLVPVIKKGALSVDVGPMVIAGFAKTVADEEQARAVLKQVDGKRYDLLSKLTAGILKAAKADGSIDLNVAFGKDAKAQGYLNDQLGIALGFKEVVKLNAGTPQEMERVVWAKSVAGFVLSTKEEKGTEVGKRRDTLRSNFIHALKKCQQAAASMIENKINVKMDDKAGTLLISGPKVKEVFGQPTVHLNEKQTVGDGEGAVKLTEKPSFTAVAAMSKKAADSVKRGSNTRGRSKDVSNPTGALEDITKSYLSIVNKLAEGKLLDPQRVLMTKVRDRLDEILD